MSASEHDSHDSTNTHNITDSTPERSSIEQDSSREQDTSTNTADAPHKKKRKQTPLDGPLPDEPASLTDVNFAQREIENILHKFTSKLTRQHLRVLYTMQQIPGWTRIIALIPAFGLFISSISLSIRTVIDVIRTIRAAAFEHLDLIDLATKLIENADVFLLAVVLYIMALGLFTLFVSKKTPLPSWLRFNDFDDLKERLVSVICVMMGVHFLGVVLHGDTSINLLWLGLSSAIVILAMTVFVRLVIFQPQHHDHEE